MKETKIAEGMERAFKLREELFNIANEFALKGQGEAAGYLHEAANNVLFANNVLNGEPAISEMDLYSRAMNKMAMLQLGIR